MLAKARAKLLRSGNTQRGSIQSVSERVGMKGLKIDANFLTYLISDKVVQGTSQKITKSFRRYGPTSVPDPMDVRPLHILVKSLNLVKANWRDHQDYDDAWVCKLFLLASLFPYHYMSVQTFPFLIEMVSSYVSTMVLLLLIIILNIC